MADIIINGTTVRVSSGVVSSGLHVTSDGEVTVLDGGVVTDAEATRYGFFWVEEGGFLQNTFLHDSGEAFVSGGSAQNLTMQSGGQANIMSGLFRSGTVLDGGVGVIYTTASGYDVTISSGGRYLVYGGYAENTRVAGGGSFTIQLSGGLASETTVESGGTARIVSGAVASKNTLNGGRMEVLMGMADDVTILNGGRLKVHAAGEAQTITVSDGLLEVETGTVYDTFLSGGSADIRKGAAFRFNQFGGSADVMSGTVVTGGTLAGGVMTVWTGATLMDYTFLGGQLSIDSGVVVSRGELKMDLRTASGAIYRETAVKSALFDVESGAEVEGIVVSDSGRMAVHDGAVVTGTTVDKNGAVTLLSGGRADGIAVVSATSSSAGVIVISSYTWGPSSLASDGGVLLMSSGAVATNVELMCGTVCVYDGGLISGARMTSGGALHIESGGVVRNAVLNGTRYDYIIMGGSGIPSEPSLGYVYVSAGGLLENAEATWLQISVSGGVIRGLTVSNTSIITVDGGGTLTGRLSFVNGATVNMAGGFLDFDISAYEPGSAAVVNNLQCIKGAPIYTVTLSADQAAGRYRLADKAHGFGSTITVRAANWETLGTLTVNALTEIGGRYYQTKVKNESLYLTIWDEMPAVLDDPWTVYVNPGWESLASGSVVGTPVGPATVGYDAFATGNDAAYAVAAGGKVVVAGGRVGLTDPVEYDMEVLGGAAIAGATVSGFGTMTLRSGAEAKDLIVTSAGLVVDQGAKLSGNCRLSGDITVNGTFEFDISGFTAGNDTALMTLSSEVKGSSDITIVVNDQQAEGVYTLTRAPVFYGYDLNTFYQYARSITVVNQSGVVLGSTSPGITGSSELGVRVGEYLYTIQQRGVYLNGPDVVLSIARVVTKLDVVFVNAGWQSKSAGDQVLVYDPVTGASKNGTIGVDAFGSIEDASAVVDVNGAIWITGGTFAPAGGIRDNILLKGGVVQNTTLYGSFEVSGGILRDVHAAAGSSISVGKNGTFSSTGGTVIDAGAEITVDGTMAFDLRGLTPGNTPLYDGLKYVNGEPDCSIQVMSDQTFGTYCLGVNAEGFNGSFTFTVNTPTTSNPGTIVISYSDTGGLLSSSGDISLLQLVAGTMTGGTVVTASESGIVAVVISGLTSTVDPTPIGLSVGGTYRNNGVAYSLSMSDGALYLTISGYEPPEAIYVCTEWADRKGGDVVTLSDGSTAVFGENAFADYRSGCEAGGENSTVYLVDGIWSLGARNWSGYKNTVLMNGTVLTGTVPNLVKKFYLTLDEGAIARDVENGGVITVKSGAILEGEIKNPEGIIKLQDGVILNAALTVRQGYSALKGTVVLENVSVLGGTGSIFIEQGGTLTGTAVFGEGMDITVNGRLDFDISGTTAGGAALFSGLSYLRGKATYSITVSNTQQYGIYRLADDAAGYDGSPIAVNNTSGVQIGSVEAGRAVKIAGSYYTLRALPSDAGYDLFLVVSELPAPETVYVNSTWTEKTFGENVEIPGGMASFLYDAFADIYEAADATPGRGTVCVTGGTLSLSGDKLSYHAIVVNGGTLALASDARIAGDVTVTNNGRLDLAKGSGVKPASITVDATGTLGGSYVFTEGMNVTVNGTLFADFAGTTASETARFEGISHVQGAPTIYVVLDAKQTAGTYLIATDAARIGQIVLRFGEKRSYKSDGSYSYDTFTLGVNSGDVLYSEKTISVTAVMDDSGTLALRVEGYVKPSIVYANEDLGWNVPLNTIVETVEGGTAVYGYDAFNKGNDALDNLADGGTLILDRGKLESRTLSAGQNVIAYRKSEIKECGIQSGSSVTAKAGSNLVFWDDNNCFYAGSTLTVEAGAVLSLRGITTIQDGVNITIDGTLDFNVTRIQKGDTTPLFNNLSLIKGNVSYRVSVDQDEMDYILASGAQDFDGTVTVVNDWNGTEFGTLAVGGSFMYNDKYYYLNLRDSGELCLTISKDPILDQVYLNSEWAELEAGTVIQVGGTTATLGYDAFASYADVKAKYRTVPKMFVTGGTVSFYNDTAANLTTVRAGAILTDATVNGYSLTLENGATGRNITVSGNIFTLENGALAQDVRVSGGTVLMENGAIAAGIIVTNGLLQVESASAQNVSVTGGMFAVAGGTSVIGLTVSGGTVELGRASVVGLTFYGGKLTLENGATVRDLTVSLAQPMPGYLTFNSVAGAVLSGTITVGSQTKLTGGATFADDAVITIDGVLEFDISGMTASGSALYNRLSAIRGDTTFLVAVSASQTAGDYVLASGAQDFDGVISVVRDGGFSLGKLWVGGILVAENMQYTLTRDDAGQLHLICKEHITRPVVYVNSLWSSLEEGTVVQVNGQTATLGYDAFVDGASALDFLGSTSKLIVAGGTASFEYETIACNTEVWDGGCLNGVRISDATLAISGDAWAWNVTVGVVLYKSDGSISMVTGGALVMKSGATAQDLTVNAGSVTLESDVFIWNFRAGLETDRPVAGVTINSTSDVILSGTVTLGSTAKLTGGATFDSDAIITVNGVLDFDISGSAAGGDVQYRGLSLVKGAPRFTLTVNGEQGYGKYALADGVTEFDSVITVVTKAGETFGTLSVGSTLFLGNTAYTLAVNDGVLSVEIVEAEHFAKSDVDGNNVSDVLFQYTGGDNQTGYWLNGTDEWRGSNAPHPADWKLIGAYDMDGDGRADAVFAGYGVEVGGKKGAYIGYYKGGVDTDDNWVTIDFLENEANHTWHNAVGNLTGNAGRNSIVWYAPELYALGVWTDGTSEWTSLSGDFGGDAWTLVGCGDFIGEGKDSVLMSYNGGQIFYAVGFDGSMTTLGSLNWSGWQVRAIGDFAGDGKDDIVLFHAELGAMVVLADGSADDYTSIGQLDPTDWFVVGCGDYNGDQKDDLLVRQYSTGMLGYYANGNMSNWTELGRGVDMSWTVIA